MKLLKFGIAFLFTSCVVYFLNNSWNIGKPIPPLGKFLDPFQGFWQNAKNTKTDNETISTELLTNEVKIVYDSALIPHIYALNEDDLYFAQGYITAQNRLWQMEFQTHASSGRISEIIGKVALDFDRTQRRLGMVYAAKNSLSAMEALPPAKAILDNYTKGINAYISKLEYKTLPIEYKLLGYAPEPWTNLKTALLLKYMAKTLNMAEKDLEMTNALKVLGKETVDLLYPDNEGCGDPIVDHANNWKFKPIVLDSVPPALPNELINIKPMEKTSTDVGSNNWAVAGSKTASGSPILCNDPHLELNLPSIWYMIHLNAPGINTMGASLPGSPNVISGFNDSIAWGVTNAQRDLVDWFTIQFKDKTKNEYLSDGAWKATKKSVEEIKIKGGDIFYDTVVYTHHGPVVYDETFHSENEMKHFAFRWVAHDPSEEMLTFYKLNKAKNHEDYMAALSHYSSPAQNFAFASVSGDIAMRIQGKYPVRRKDEGKFILDGTKTSSDWHAFIPNEQNIMYKNPERGFVSSANQYPVDTTYPYYINGDSWEAYRNRRINQVLTSLTNVTPQDLMKLQLDNYNLKAAESLPFFLSQLDTTALKGSELIAFQKLKAWDFFNTVQSEGASYYEAWLRSFLPMVWDEIDSSKVALSRPSTYLTFKLMKEKPELSFFDVKHTPEKETVREVVQKSFSLAVAAIEKWKEEKKTNPTWGDYKDAVISHLLKQEGFSYHVKHGGNSSIVNAHSKRNGPSWRMVVSLEKTGIQAWGVYPGGQSGNPGSPYYNNLIQLWEAGNYIKFTFVPEAEKMKGKTLATVTLNPSKK
jgi:penicillin amidase